MSFWAEIRRRKAFKVAAVYAVVAWLLIQVVSTIEQPLGLPGWFDTTVIVLLAIGFPITLVLTWAFSPSSEQLVGDHGGSDANSRRIGFILLGSAVIAAAWLIYTVAFERDDPAERDVPPGSIAVLLCDNLSPDPDNAFFAAGLHEAILDRLVKLRDLTVMSRTSVLKYAEAPRPSVEQIADELRVESVMECSVSYAGDRVAISAQLIDGATGAHLWSERYFRDFRDVFGIQADIAMNVANALVVGYSTEEQQAIERRETSSPAAYALYLRALDDENSNAVSQQLLDRAIAIDPRFAAAYGAKAFFYTYTLFNNAVGQSVAPDERGALEGQIRDFAARALAIDPNEAYARRALRRVNIPTWRWSSLIEAIGPEDERDLSASELWVFSWMGMHDTAIRIAERVFELNPNDASSFANLGIVLAYAGDRAAAARNLRNAVELMPASPLWGVWLAYTQVASGEVDDALHQLQLVEQILGADPPVVYLPELAYSYSRIGRNDDARRLFDAMQTPGSRPDLDAGALAMAYLAIGDEASSLMALEEVANKARRHEVEEGLLNVMNLKMNFLADPVLEKPEFRDVLSRIVGD